MRYELLIKAGAAIVCAIAGTIGLVVIAKDSSSASIVRENEKTRREQMRYEHPEEFAKMQREDDILKMQSEIETIRATINSVNTKTNRVEAQSKEISRLLDALFFANDENYDRRDSSRSLIEACKAIVADPNSSYSNKEDALDILKSIARKFGGE